MVAGQVRSYVFYGQAIGSLLSGLLFEVIVSLPFFNSVVFMFVSAMIACFFVESLVEKKSGAENYLLQVK
ncbi:MAG: hypothetical protein JEZ08_14280 [Clostridiales bacterium]|nr:hypothetical protein [Clostridiales bacterium]